MSTNDPTTVTYTVKELLSRIDTKLDGFAVRLDLKAEQAHVETIERRVTALESERATRAAVGRSRSWLFNKTGVVIVGTAAVISAIAGAVYAAYMITSH